MMYVIINNCFRDEGLCLIIGGYSAAVYSFVVQLFFFSLLHKQ